MRHFSPVFGDFVHPAMLGWLAVAAAPLVIHLILRARYREVAWGAMRFLAAAMRQDARRVRIEQWLLLALRILILALVVLAVAEPRWETAGRAGSTSERVHRLLVIDGSYSMAYRAGDRSRFERARQTAAEIVDQSQLGDAFSLVLMGEPPRAIVAGPAFEKTELVAEIESLVLPHAGGDLTATLRLLAEMVGRAHQTHPRLDRTEVVFLTDLGRTSWAPAGNDRAAIAATAQAARELAERAELVVVDLGQPRAENLAIAGLSLASPRMALGQEAQLDIEVRNFSREPAPQRKVELLVDGQLAAQSLVDAPAAGRAAARVALRLDTLGDHVVEARLAEDSLDLDNHRWLVAHVHAGLRVLCVDGRAGSAAGEGAARFLQLALAPTAGEATRSAVEVRVVRERDFREIELSEYDCLFLLEVPAWTTGEAAALLRYTERGGGVVWFLGPEIDAESYNRVLGPELLPVELQAPAPAASYELDPLRYEHPILQVFRGQERSGLLGARVERYQRIVPRAERAARVALALAGGDPLIVEGPVGRGRVVVVATTADTAWATLPLWPSYVPLVQELLRFSLRGREAGRSVLVGEVLTGEASPAQTTMTVVAPSGERLSAEVRRDEGAWWTFAGTQSSGVYRVGPKPETAAAPYVVNLRTAESDLAKVAAEELTSTIWPNVPCTVQTSWEESAAGPASAIVRRRSLHQLLLLIAGALLLVESGYALWLGRRAR
jgi:Aerotolerance regulator N-terminal/von Willebrand factor type A domain